MSDTVKPKKPRTWCPKCQKPVRMSLDSFPAWCADCFYAGGPRVNYLVIDDDGETYITQMEQWRKRNGLVSTATHGPDEARGMKKQILRRPGFEPRGWRR